MGTDPEQDDDRPAHDLRGQGHGDGGTQQAQPWVDLAK